jgi:hypothetical protein
MAVANPLDDQIENELAATIEQLVVSDSAVREEEPKGGSNV